jgi:two-component system NtrC family sensor kinase
VAASDPDVASAFSRWIGGRAKPAAGKLADLRDVSADMKVGPLSTAFFFSPVTNESGEPVAWISVGLSRDDQIAFRNTILLWVSMLAAGLAALVAWLTVSISRRITRPISELVQAAERVRRGEWVEPVEADSRSEIGFLVKRFNDMALGVQVTKRTLETKLEELARAHDELTRTQDQLVQSAKMGSLGQLVAGVAHELNNPIAFIYSNMSQMRGYLKNIDEMDALTRELRERLSPTERAAFEKRLEDLEWDYLRQDMKEIVQSCLEGSIRVKDIVLGLRNFSRADKGDVADVDINQALENTAKLLVGQIKNRVEVHWNLCPDGRLRCNLAQVNQVLMNLMANALQAIEGRGNVWVETRAEERDGHEEMVVSIRDDGKGIPPEQIDRIFDPFFTTKKVGEGTGLGLSIVYGIVERHRGSIHVRSITRDADARHHGTEFTVRLPRRGPAGAADEGPSDRRSA